jgi:hypothetical protein
MLVIQSMLALTVTALVVLAVVLSYIMLALSGGAAVLANRIGQGRREAFVIRPQRPLAAPGGTSAAKRVGYRPAAPVTAFRAS